jgi:hypothetical protein
VNNKVYDGTTTASIASGIAQGVLPVDANNISLTPSGTFTSANAGVGISVNLSYSLSGTAASNYVISQPTGLTATITPKTLTVTGQTAASKVYDATTTASMAGGSLSGVVGADERESCLRAILNSGHTFGHAIEAGAGYGQWLHGEAVGAGMVMAADLSHRLGLVGAAVPERLRAAVVAAGLPVEGPGWPAERYVQLMSVDKKASQGIPKFVLLEALGRAVVRSAPADLVHQTLRACSAAAAKKLSTQAQSLLETAKKLSTQPQSLLS